MKIGSGDIGALMTGLKTKAQKGLFQKFLSDTPVFYNALASPLDAARTGAIIEEVYFKQLPDDYYPQMKFTCEEMNVFTCSLDFCKMDKGVPSHIIELKSVWFEEFQKIDSTLEQIKKKYKKYYNQVQEQMLCTGIESIDIRFIAVYSYDDETNWNRKIEDCDIKNITIPRDEERIVEIKERGTIFQQLKDRLE